MSEFRRLLFPSGSPLVDNFRPVQALGNRVVQFAVPTNIVQSTTVALVENSKSGVSNKPSWSYFGDTGK